MIRNNLNFLNDLNGLNQGPHRYFVQKGQII
jgi:hypothetical protein